MTLDQYSVVLSLGLFGLTALVLLLLLVQPLRAWVAREQRAMWLLFLVSLSAVLGALIYQLVYLTPVCELCWWQRIFLFPVVVISGAALYTKSRDAHVPIAILSVLGLGYALYHYWYHYQGLVLGNILSLPCSTGGLLPACTESPILTFGFITIPFMGILTFAILLVLALFAGKAQRQSLA